MQIIAIISIKGGSGKTSTAAALTQAAASSGYKVLLIDADPQGNAGFFLAATRGPGTLALLEGGNAAELIQTTRQGVDVITAERDLATVKTDSASGRRLLRSLKRIRDAYDYIFIDTPSFTCDLHTNALQAATGAIIPLEADLNNLDGFYKAVEIIRQMQKGANPALKICGAVLTRYDGRPKLNRFLRDQVRLRVEEAGVRYLDEIRQSITLKEAQSFQQSLFEYAPRSQPAADYMALFQKIREE